MSSSYAQKAVECMRAAKLLHEQNLFENAVSQSYYAMYCMSLSVLKNYGIQSPTHEGTIAVFEFVLEQPELARTLRQAKDVRIENQ